MTSVLTRPRSWRPGSGRTSGSTTTSRSFWSRKSGPLVKIGWRRRFLSFEGYKGKIFCRCRYRIVCHFYFDSASQAHVYFSLTPQAFAFVLFVVAREKISIFILRGNTKELTFAYGSIFLLALNPMCEISFRIPWIKAGPTFTAVRHSFHSLLSHGIQFLWIWKLLCWGSALVMGATDWEMTFCPNGLGSA